MTPLQTYLSDTDKLLKKEELKKIAEDIQQIIDESRATFFVSKDDKDIEIPPNEIIYELRAEISNNIGLYFYNKFEEMVEK